MKLFVIGTLVIFTIYFKLVESSDKPGAKPRRKPRKPQSPLPNHPVNVFASQDHQRWVESIHEPIRNPFTSNGPNMNYGGFSGPPEFVYHQNYQTQQNLQNYQNYQTQQNLHNYQNHQTQQNLQNYQNYQTQQNLHNYQNHPNSAQHRTLLSPSRQQPQSGGDLEPSGSRQNNQPGISSHGSSHEPPQDFGGFPLNFFGNALGPGNNRHGN